MFGENARLLIQEFEQEPFRYIDAVQTKVKDRKTS